MRALIKAGFVSLVLSLNLAVAVMAGPLEDIDTANRNGDYPTALRLLRPLAEQGNAAAQDRLGLMYRAGAGVPQDYVQAYTWFSKAAEQDGMDTQDSLGIADAQDSLGALYSAGVGVPQNYIQAYKWFSLAAAHWPGGSPGARGGSIYARDSVAAKLTPDQLAEAQKLASEWRPK